MERHPLAPFLPSNARILMLGSFPPPRKRWSVDFFYPNMQNDMWRIFGVCFFGDRDYFIEEGGKRYALSRLTEFLTEKGVALYDTACAVNRLRDNASDKFLEVVEYTDVDALLQQIPMCRAIVTTGQKATDTLRAHFLLDDPRVGESVPFTFRDRTMRLWRMPSSSRAYPLPLAKKTDTYARMFRSEGLLL